MSLLEWLKFWSKFYSLPLFCRIAPSPPLPLPQWKLSESPGPSTEYPPKWKLSESTSPSTEYPPMKIVRESKSKYRIPPNENCQRVQVWVQNTPRMKIVRDSKSKFQNTPPPMKIVSPNLRVSEYPPKWKLSESKSEYRIPPPQKSEKLQISE